VAAAAVLGLHTLAAVLARQEHGHLPFAEQLVAVRASLVLSSTISAALPPEAPFVLPNLTPPAPLSIPLVSTPRSLNSVMAVTVSATTLAPASAVVSAVEAVLQNERDLQGACFLSGSLQITSDPAAPMSMLVYVGGDGRVLDIKVEKSYGPSPVDEAVRSCIWNIGIFLPLREGGVSVPSWQRLRVSSGA
jgi:hypothetical protein